MRNKMENSSSLMARLTLSALERAIKDSSAWQEPVVYRALLVTGLTVLVSANNLLILELKDN